MQERPKHFGKAVYLLQNVKVGCPLATQKFVTDVMICMEERKKDRFQEMPEIKSSMGSGGSSSDVDFDPDGLEQKYTFWY